MANIVSPTRLSSEEKRIRVLEIDLSKAYQDTLKFEVVNKEQAEEIERLTGKIQELEKNNHFLRMESAEQKEEIGRLLIGRVQELESGNNELQSCGQNHNSDPSSKRRRISELAKELIIEIFSEFKEKATCHKKKIGAFALFTTALTSYMMRK